MTAWQKPLLYRASCEGPSLYRTSVRRGACEARSVGRPNARNFSVACGWTLFIQEPGQETKENRSWECMGPSGHGVLRAAILEEEGCTQCGNYVCGSLSYIRLCLNLKSCGVTQLVDGARACSNTGNRDRSKRSYMVVIIIIIIIITIVVIIITTLHAGLQWRRNRRQQQPACAEGLQLCRDPGLRSRVAQASGSCRRVCRCSMSWSWLKCHTPCSSARSGFAPVKPNVD